MRSRLYHKQFLRWRLVPNWRQVHRSTTVVLSILLVALSAAHDQLALFQAFISPEHFATVSLVIGVAIAVFRYIEQPALHGDTQSKEPSQ